MLMWPIYKKRPSSQINDDNPHTNTHTYTLTYEKIDGDQWSWMRLATAMGNWVPSCTGSHHIKSLSIAIALMWCLPRTHHTTAAEGETLKNLRAKLKRKKRTRYLHRQRIGWRTVVSVLHTYPTDAALRADFSSANCCGLARRSSGDIGRILNGELIHSLMCKCISIKCVRMSVCIHLSSHAIGMNLPTFLC